MRIRVNRQRTWAAACVAVISALFAVACAESIHVRTAEAPDANFSHATTYRLLTPGEKHAAIAANKNTNPNGTTNETSGGDVASNSNPAQSSNPILQSPIAMQQLRTEIQSDLEARGYHREKGQSDLTVAYYMGVHNQLQVTDYGYGYPFWGWGGWRWGPGWGGWPAQQVTQYEQGTIIVDVLDGSGRRLLWRGMAHVSLPGNDQDYPKVIAEGVNAIMAKFPGRAKG